MAESELYRKGAALRRQLLGDAAVERSDPHFPSRPMQALHPSIHVIDPETDVVQLGSASVRFPRRTATTELVELEQEPVLRMLQLDAEA